MLSEVLGQSRSCGVRHLLIQPRFSNEHTPHLCSVQPRWEIRLEANPLELDIRVTVAHSILSGLVDRGTSVDAECVAPGTLLRSDGLAAPL